MKISFEKIGTEPLKTMNLEELNKQLNVLLRGGLQGLSMSVDELIEDVDIEGKWDGDSRKADIFLVSATSPHVGTPVTFCLLTHHSKEDFIKDIAEEPMMMLYGMVAGHIRPLPSSMFNLFKDSLYD